jgi:hypothetical protein
MGGVMFFSFSRPSRGTIYTGFIWHVGNNKPIYGGKQNDALYLREILFEVNHTIPTEQQDHRLLEKLLAEKQGIILKCLYAARKAIYDNDYRFDVPAECERAKSEHKHSNSVVKVGFVMGRHGGIQTIEGSEELLGLLLPITVAVCLSKLAGQGVGILRQPLPLVKRRGVGVVVDIAGVIVQQLRQGRIGCCHI